MQLLVASRNKHKLKELAALLKDLPLADATRAVAEGRVLLDGKRYEWETEEMVHWLEPREEDRAAVDAAKAQSRFTLERADAGGSGGAGSTR